MDSIASIMVGKALKGTVGIVSHLGRSVGMNLYEVLYGDTNTPQETNCYRYCDT